MDLLEEFAFYMEIGKFNDREKKIFNHLNSKNNRLRERLEDYESNVRYLESDYKYLQQKYNREIDYMKNNYNNLQQQNENNERQINYLSEQNNKLIREKKEEEEKKINFQKTFNNDMNLIKNNNLNKSKNYISNFIINEFVKQFEKETIKQNSFTKSLTDYMKKFSLEFMTYNQYFIQSFKVNSQNIIKNYKVYENKTSINHINFIVIGKAGTGKSSFINESLLLTRNKRAKEGEGVSVTEKSNLYCSDKLKMIRMWDTQGIDYNITQEKILNEVKRIVDEGLEKGPDHYINIILYCTCGNRFQEEDGQLIHKIMKLYPMDNLPVIITQLQSYFKEDSKRMEIIIRKILSNYLENKIVEKIEIKSLIARDKQVDGMIFKAYGIPELLKCSFDIMGRSITSATFKKFSEDIENMCKKYVDVKIDFIQKIFKDENEILEIAKDKYIDDSDKYFINEEKKYKNLGKNNIYNKITQQNYFINNFIKIMSSKFIDIYNNLNNANISINNNNKEKPLVLIFILDRLQILQKILNDNSTQIFEKIYKELFNELLSDLHLQQSSRKKQFNVNYDVIDSYEINQNFKNELFQFFKDEFFKYFFCLILKLFKENLQNILIDNYKKELKENEEMTKIINEKAEFSLKFVTNKLKNDLLEEIDKYYPKDNEIKLKPKNKKDFNVDFNFPEY